MQIYLYILEYVCATILSTYPVVVPWSVTVHQEESSDYLVGDWETHGEISYILSVTKWIRIIQSERNGLKEVSAYVCTAQMSILKTKQIPIREISRNFRHCCSGLKFALLMLGVILIGYESQHLCLADILSVCLSQRYHSNFFFSGRDISSNKLTRLEHGAFEGLTEALSVLWDIITLVLVKVHYYTCTQISLKWLHSYLRMVRITLKNTSLLSNPKSITTAQNMPSFTMTTIFLKLEILIWF